ncbi:MAG: NB-ARC domain-containing protein [Chloroflexi bacterium]|nr:NB-ARC domain-containing protein [Chloroflexota bacterium]
MSTEAGIRHLRPTLVSLEDLLERILQLFEHGEYSSSGLEKSKEVVVEILSAYKTLIILDNMETISDGRIMEFIRSLPQETRAKVLLTSRRRTSEWEYPIQVTELSQAEVRDFIGIRCNELGLDFPTDRTDVIERITQTSGGSPLAIQWTLGEYAKTRDLEAILARALTPDSPLLEFSFRNSWNVLDHVARQALAVLSIFEEPPTAQMWRTALDWPVEKIERAISSLVEVTFVAERTERRTGVITYRALPITLSFARNELAKMGELERESRLKYQQLRNSLELASVETRQYTDLFTRFGATTDT